MARDWKNAPIDMNEFGGSRLSLKVENIGKATATVITVRDVERVEMPDPDRDDGKRIALVLQSDEYPDRGFWLNKSGLKTLMDKIGVKPSSWVGEQVPLVRQRVNNPQTGRVQESLQVATPAEWDEVMAEYTGAPKRATKRAAKLPTKRRG